MLSTGQGGELLGEQNYMEWHGEAEFQCLIGLGFNLCVVPP